MLRLTDTGTGALEAIVPSTRGLLKVYACGTNLRTFVLTDLIRRTAVAHRWQVRLVQGSTDVLPESFRRDLSLIGVHPADTYPRASECIDVVLAMIERLIENGQAYVDGDGTVNFSAKPYWPLWKPAREQDEAWDSPWGRGGPGAHVVCSATSLELLGSTIDVHTGGIDQRFPHHEHERALTDCVAGKEVVRHWVHSATEPAGNGVLVSDAVDRGFDPLALRLALLGTGYRQQADLSWDSIAGANTSLSRWRAAVARWAEEPSKPICVEVQENVLDAFSDDLDTPRALQVLRDFENADMPAGCKFETFAWADRLLGLDLARDVGRA